MEIIKTVKKDEIPKSSLLSEKKKKFLRAVATLSESEALHIKVKNEAEAQRLTNWLKGSFKNVNYKLTRRKINNEIFAYIYQESK